MLSLLLLTAQAIRHTYTVRSGDTLSKIAEKFGTTFDDELHRVIIHSILHLCGLEDHTPEERQQMEEAENVALSMLWMERNV